MKISIFTPTHNPKYLLETYESLKNQTNPNWEWIIVPNNGATIQKKIRDDKRVVIVNYPLKNESSIGKLKRFACENAKGDILLELDHDDLLTSDALEVCQREFEQDTELSFLASQTARFNENGEYPIPYNKAYGWKSIQQIMGGKKCTINIHFQPRPHSLAFIYYSPDHFRAWRADFYKKIGGHNGELEICDDHELMIRTYLQGKMKLLPSVHYLYRLHTDGSNTWKQRQSKIDITTGNLYKKYIRQMVERWCDLNGYLKVELGPGRKLSPGYLGLDNIVRGPGIKKQNLEKKLKLKTNSVGIIVCQDVLEHVKNVKDLMDEIHRVLVPGGWFISKTPSTDGRGAFQDYDHVSFWNENNFLYWTNKEQAEYHDNTKARFQAYRLETNYPNDWARQKDIKYVEAHLVAIKDGYGDTEREKGLIPHTLTI